jgi:hypothetical protein
MLALGLLSGCATGAPQQGLVRSSPVPSNAPDSYAQSTGSATSSCLRNPACYTQAGDEAVIPWIERSIGAARTAATALRLLEAAEVARVERIQVQCAKDADFEINEAKFGKGQSPTAEQCKQVLRREGNKEVTMAMELGSKKHQRALSCVQEQLGKLFPENFTVQPHYKQDPRTGLWYMLDPQQVKQWLLDGLTSMLLGTLVPDVVLHASGNPNKVQRVYDYKFPCLTERKESPD